MNQRPENFFDSASPEQKLHSLTAELRTPVEIIRGSAETIRRIDPSLNIDPVVLSSGIDAISEAADKIRNLLDEVVRSKGFYSPSHDLSSTDILLGLRQHLLDARQQNDMDTLQNLAVFLNLIWEIAAKRDIQGRIFRILEDLERSAWDSTHGISWKSTIPSEEEIISALNTN